MWDPCDSGKYLPEIQKQSFDNINFTQQKSFFFSVKKQLAVLVQQLVLTPKLNDKLTNWQMICLDNFTY